MFSMRQLECSAGEPLTWGTSPMKLFSVLATSGSLPKAGGMASNSLTVRPECRQSR